MSESKHTPGPWSYRHVDGYGPDQGHTIIGPENHLSGHSPADPDGKPVMVADVNGLDRHRLVAPECIEANAHLIAAAPELLAALEAMLGADLYADAEGVWDFARSDTETGRAAVLLARTAIQKAKGGAS